MDNSLSQTLKAVAEKWGNNTDEPQRLIADSTKSIPIDDQGDQETPGQKKKRRELEEEYGFLEACFLIDAESIRSLRRLFWQINKKGDLSLHIAGIMTNVGYCLLEARMSEYLLETEVHRSQLYAPTSDILKDIDPLLRIQKRMLSRVRAQDYQYSETHFGVGIEGVFEWWKTIVH
jgi:hypothetical protein